MKLIIFLVIISNGSITYETKAGSCGPLGNAYKSDNIDNEKKCATLCSQKSDCKAATFRTVPKKQCDQFKSYSHRPQPFATCIYDIGNLSCSFPFITSILVTPTTTTRVL